jgi:dipeptide transport system substrate-binding protein
VFCSEGSPAGFDTAQYTTATDNDAAEPLYNRLVEFERRDQRRTGPGHRVGYFRGRPRYTFHLRGVKFHSNKAFKPTRDFNADDVLFTFNRMLDPTTLSVRPTHRVSVFQRHEPEQEHRQGRKDRALTVVFTLNTVDAAFIQNIAMSFAAILSAEYADSCCWKASRATSTRNRSAPGRSCSALPERLADPLHRQQTVLGPEPGQARQPDLRHQHRRVGARAEAQGRRMPGHPAPAPGRRRRTQGRPEAAAAEQAGFNLGYIAYNVRHKPFDQLEVRQALDMAVNKQASSTPFTRARATGGQRHAADPVVLRRQHQGRRLRPGKSQGPAQGRRREGRHRDHPVGHAGAAPVQPQRQADGRNAPGDWAKIGLKVKIVSYEWGEYIKRTKNGEHDISLIGWTGDNGDPDNWLGTLYSCDAIGGNNYSMWCDPAYDKLIKSQGRHRPRTAHRALQTGAAVAQAASADHARRPLDGQPAVERQSRRLQGEPLRSQRSRASASTHKT